MKSKLMGFVVGSALLFAGALPALAASPAITVSAPNPAPFGTLSISGSGFGSGEVVHLSLGTASVNATADGGGNFGGASLTIPNVPSGLYFVIAQGQSSGAFAFSQLWVNALMPQVSPSSWYIPPGSSLTWSGSGFAPNESVSVKDASDNTVATITADQSGSFMSAGASIVPFSARNALTTYTLHGNTSNATFSLTLSVANLYPFANPSIWYAAPGTTVTFSGGGFGPNETINLFKGSASTPLASFTADSSGSFSAQGSTQLPFGASVTYRLVGAQSGVEADAPVTLAQLYPTLNPSSYYSAPGGMISLTGSGFAGGESIAVKVGNGAPQTVTADAMGTFSLPSLQMPVAPNSSVVVIATGALSGAVANFTMAIGQFYPSLSPSTYYAFPGDPVVFSGSGFAPNETLTISGVGSGTVTTDNSGAFSGLSLPLPSGTSATFNFTGSVSGGPIGSTITIGQRFSWLNLSTYWAQGGSPLTITGGGFRANEPVAFSLGGNTFANGSADPSGNLNVMTSVPFAPSGSATIHALGSLSGATADVPITIAPVYTDFELGSYAVAPGAAVHFIGHGYLPNEPVKITTDRTGSTVVATITADAGGNFDDSSYTLPADFTMGNLTLTATGAHSFDVKSITMFVTGS